MNLLKLVQKQQAPQLYFELQEQQQSLINMVVDYQNSSHSALCKTDNNQFKITFDGFWRHKVLVKDMSGSLVALVYAETLFSDTSFLRIGDKLLRLKFRDNPSTELIIFEEEYDPKKFTTCHLSTHTRRNQHRSKCTRISGLNQ